MGTESKYTRPPTTPPTDPAVLAELRAVRLELAALRKLFDTFAGVFLNSKFPFGQPVDRWRRRG